jgi:hypothetical protein
LLPVAAVEEVAGGDIRVVAEETDIVNVPPR